MMHFWVEPNDVKAVGDSKNSHEEDQQEYFDIYKHLDYHAHKGRSWLEKSHEVEQS